jgi:hypothetical protein
VVQEFNRYKTLAASAARTATLTGDAQSNPNHRGVLLIVDVTTGTSGQSLVPSIQAQDPVSGHWFQIHDSYAAITSASAATYRYLLYPGVSETEGTAGLTQANSGCLPLNWRVLMTPADTKSITYSVGAQMLR